MNIVNPQTSIPSDLVAYFPSSCPSGWSEYTAVRGRYIVATPSGGDMGDTVGSALTNKQDRAVGQHNHTFSGSALSAHGHNFSGDALATHNHSFSGSGMGSHGHTQSAHNHPFRMVNDLGSGSSAYSDSVLTSASSGSQANTKRTADNVTIRSSTISDTTPSINGASAGTPSGTNSAITAGTPSGTNATQSGGTPSGTVGNTGTTTSTNAPYIQLICCKKN